VPGAALAAEVPPTGGPASGAGAVAGGGQHAARPPAVGGQDAGTAPSWPAVAEAAQELRSADGAAAAGRGARELPAARERGRDGHGAEPIVSRGQEASGPLPADGRGHGTGATDGVPERARPEALALHAAEQLTDT